MLQFTGERIVPGAANCEPTFARKMYQEHVARYQFASALAAKAAVLDVGCGVGYGSQHLARNGAATVLAIDIAADAIDHARAHFAHPLVHFECRSALDLDMPGRFDLVTCFEVIEHLTAADQEQLLDVIKRSLKPKGILAVSTPRPHETMRSDYHVHELNSAELAAMLQSRFATVRSFFEGNYFTSYIGTGRPQSIPCVVPITDQFDHQTADYHVFLATSGDAASLQDPGGVIVMNDDAYVLNLERDVAILHRSEDDAKQRIADLETENEATIRSGREREAAQRAATNMQIMAASAARTLAENKLMGTLGALGALKVQCDDAEAFAASAREAVIHLRQQLDAMRARAENAEAGHAHELAQAQMLHRVLFEHSEALKATILRAETAEALHAHELGQAQMLHQSLFDHSEELKVMIVRAETAEALHGHELDQAQMLHDTLQDHSDVLREKLVELDAVSTQLAQTTSQLNVARDAAVGREDAEKRAMLLEQAFVEVQDKLVEANEELARMKEELRRRRRAGAFGWIAALRPSSQARDGVAERHDHGL